MADNVLGRIILEAGAKAGAMTGGGAPPISGLLEGDSPPSGGGGSESSSKEAHANRFRKGIEGFNKKSLDFAKAQPKWFTSIFKKMGIQMGLSGILKQSQIFTSTIGSLFQIFGAFVDVMLAPLIRPLILPILRWLARRIPDVSRASKQFWHFTGVVLKGFGKFVKNIFTKSFWTDTVFSGIIKFFTETFPDKIKEAFKFLETIGSDIWQTFKEGMKSAWNSTLGGEKVLAWTIPNWGSGGGSAQGRNEKFAKENPIVDTSHMPDAAVNRGGPIYAASEENLESSYGSSYGGGPMPTPVPTPTAIPLAQVVPSTNPEEGKTKSWFSKIFDPSEWLGVFGDFKQEFTKFWSGSAMENALKGAGVAVVGSLGYKVTKKMVSSMSSAFNAVMWTPAKLMKLINAAADIPGMMGLNTAKWAVRQMNMFDPSNITRTLLSKGLSEGGSDLARRAVKTMGGGVANASLDVWRNATSPISTGSNLASRATNFVLRRGGADAALSNADDLLMRNSLDVPLKNPQIFDPSAKLNTPTPTPEAPRVARTGRMTRLTEVATKKFTTFSDGIKAFMRGVASWGWEKIMSKGEDLARLGNEAFTAARTAGMPAVLGKISMLKSFLGRLVPFAASGIAIATTGKNIADIANMEHLSWWQPHEGMLDAQLNPILENMKATMDKDTGGGNFFSTLLNKYNRSQELERSAADLQGAVMGSYLMGTKGGAIGTQAIMGGADAFLGFGGATTLPLQAAIMAGQYAHMEGVKGYNQSAGEWTGTLDELLSVTDIGMSARDIENAVEQGMSRALKNSTLNGTIDINGSSMIEYQ